MAVSHQMTLAGHRLRVAPDEVRWNFKMKVSDQAAVGGKVIQILGLTTSDITVSGTFSPDRREGDQEAWQQAERFRQEIKTLAREHSDDPTIDPVRLTYPARGWDFEVYIKAISAYEIKVDEIAPKWTLTLFPVGEGARKVVKGIKDLYIERLMEGVGWKQTSYNGPMTQEIVDQLMGGLSAEEFYVQEMAAAATGDGEGDG